MLRRSPRLYTIKGEASEPGGEFHRRTTRCVATDPPGRPHRLGEIAEADSVSAGQRPMSASVAGFGTVQFPF
jgi:hypothetical protein